MNLSDVWADLDRDNRTDPGILRRRIFPESTHDVFLQIRRPEGLRSVAMRLAGPHGETWREIRSSRGLHVRAGVESDEISVVQLEETDQRYRQIFHALVRDVLDHLSALPSPGRPLDTVSARIQVWQACMEQASDGALGEDRQEGLLAELIVLEEEVLPAQGPAGLAAWKGPLEAVQDFQWATHALEVKSSRAAEPQHMQINGERQLDSTGLERLFLTHVALDRREAGTGQTLPERVASVRRAVEMDPAGLQLFEDRLLRAGYLPFHEDRYGLHRYSVRHIHHFAVVQGFPRIVESDLSDGIGQVTYKLAIAACQPYAVTTADIRAALSGART